MHLRPSFPLPRCQKPEARRRLRSEPLRFAPKPAVKKGSNSRIKRFPALFPPFRCCFPGRKCPFPCPFFRFLNSFFCLGRKVFCLPSSRICFRTSLFRLPHPFFYLTNPFFCLVNKVFCLVHSINSFMSQGNRKRNPFFGASSSEKGRRRRLKGSEKGFFGSKPSFFGIWGAVNRFKGLKKSINSFRNRNGFRLFRFHPAQSRRASFGLFQSRLIRREMAPECRVSDWIPRLL